MAYVLLIMVFSFMFIVLLGFVLWVMALTVTALFGDVFTHYARIKEAQKGWRNKGE